MCPDKFIRHFRVVRGEHIMECAGEVKELCSFAPDITAAAAALVVVVVAVAIPAVV